MEENRIPTAVRERSIERGQAANQGERPGSGNRPDYSLSPA